jgi:hypothetical protein
MATLRHKRTSSHRRSDLFLRMFVGQLDGGDGGCSSLLVIFVILRGRGDSNEMAKSVGEGGGSLMGGGRARPRRVRDEGVEVLSIRPGFGGVLNGSDDMMR